MTQFAIQVEDIGKRFNLSRAGNNTSLRENLNGMLTAPFRRAASALTGRPYRPPEPKNAFWALRHISFEVRQGETLGIVGPNGSGKSTLLKILSRITRPSEGSFMVRGRLGSLLEVGTGFHPDLTGRENVYLNGSILGMRRSEIAAKFDSIVDFAEIAEFIDTPVKFYSSGMYIRLAFSVAVHLDADILLLDEVLMVGDLSFQKKSQEKMLSIAQDGRTVVMVSHIMPMVRELCTRVIWLQKGSIRMDDATPVVLDAYEKSITPGSDKIRRAGGIIVRGDAE